MPMSDATGIREQAMGTIRDAFPVDVAPPLDQLQNNHCLECSEVAATFSGKPWSEVSISDLDRNLGVPLMTPAAFRYYLPALMLRCMEARRELDTVPDAVVGRLAPRGGRLAASDADALAGFTRQQVLAILSFLRWSEAQEKLEWSKPGWSTEAVDAVPADKVLARAIRHWSRVLDESSEE
jgi:hypothetical protein